MPVIDQHGRVFRLVNVVDLLVVLLTVAVAAAASALLLPQSIAGVAVLGLGIVSLAGLVVLSRRRYEVAWSEVRSAMTPEFSLPTLGGIKRWFTAEPDPDVVVIDLRETITVAPFIIALDWIVGSVAGVYRDSWLDSVLGRARRGFLAAPIRIASVALLAFALVDGVADVFLNVELFTAPVGVDNGPFEWGARIAVLAVLLVGVFVDASWAEVRETRIVRGIAAALAPPDPPADAEPPASQRSSGSGQPDGATPNGASSRSVEGTDPDASDVTGESAEPDSGGNEEGTRETNPR